MTNSNNHFQWNLGILHCFDIRSSLYHWWRLYQKYNRWIQEWLLASSGNIGKRTFIPRNNSIRRWSHGYWWFFFGRQVSLLWCLCFDNWFFRDAETEIWNFGNETHRVVNQTLPNNEYAVGIGLFIVPFNFCTT